MSKIFRTPSSRQIELIVPMSNLITESLATIRFSQTNKSTHTICFACVFAAHRTPEKPQQLASFNKAVCAVLRYNNPNSQNNDLTN